VLFGIPTLEHLGLRGAQERHLYKVAQSWSYAQRADAVVEYRQTARFDILLARQCRRVNKNIAFGQYAYIEPPSWPSTEERKQVRPLILPTEPTPVKPPGPDAGG
jgi:hypothetical protein